MYGHNVVYGCPFVVSLYWYGFERSLFFDIFFQTQIHLFITTMETSVTTLSLLDVIVDIVYILFFLLMTALIVYRAVYIVKAWRNEDKGRAKGNLLALAIMLVLYIPIFFWQIDIVERVKELCCW